MNHQSQLFWRGLFCSLLFLPMGFAAQQTTVDPCPRPIAGSAVPEPQDLRSTDGTLRVALSYRTSTDASGLVRYCYLSSNGSLAPNLRVKPGDELIVTLKNDLSKDAAVVPGMAMPHHGKTSQACAGGAMAPSSTNLHFHGLEIAPVCHQDESLKTMIEPGAAPFEYRFKVPLDQPPGLYWYHPHIHGFTKAQVLGGASGALIVEGIESDVPLTAGLPERVFVIRDQELVNPNAQPVRTDSMPAPMVLRDGEGDILNTGTGGGKPAKDLSINFVPVAFPDYHPAILAMRPQEKQLWRVLNASAITYLDLQLLFNDQPQELEVVALDGVPLNYQGQHQSSAIGKAHLLLPPAGRAEFIVKGPPRGIRASLVTRTVDTGPAGENDPTRPLAAIVTGDDVPEPSSQLGIARHESATHRDAPLDAIEPTHRRLLYFSETLPDPGNPNSPTTFFLTVEGKTPKAFDPSSRFPNMTVQSGEVEDWTIENRSQELHAFHIHQTHFQLLEWNGVPVREPFLRDTINVPYWDGKSSVYPSVKLRMDFRNPTMVGTFVYHCHLLEHEDNGMMGTIQVLPPRRAAK